MPYFVNVRSPSLGKICRLCFEPMCAVDVRKTRWFHCHDCDLRNCHEEAY